jgi:hypothetical protein
MPVISALRRLRRVSHKFKASLGYIVSSASKEKKKTQLDKEQIKYRRKE